MLGRKDRSSSHPSLYKKNTPQVSSTEQQQSMSQSAWNQQGALAKGLSRGCSQVIAGAGSFHSSFIRMSGAWAGERHLEAGTHLAPWLSLISPCGLTVAQFLTWLLKVFRPSISRETGRSLFQFISKPSLESTVSLLPHLLHCGSHKDLPRSRGREQTSCWKVSDMVRIGQHVPFVPRPPGDAWSLRYY